METVMLLNVRHGKSIDPAQNETLRTLVRSIVDTKYDGNMSATAKAWGITPTGLHDFLSRKRGAGLTILEALSKHTGRSIDDLSGRASTSRIPIISTALGTREDWQALKEETLKKWPTRVDPENDEPTFADIALP